MEHLKLKFLWPVVGLSTGIFLSADLFYGLWFPCISLGLALIFWLFLYIISRDPIKAEKYGSLHVVWILFLFFSIGAFNYQLRCMPDIEKDIDSSDVIIQGSIENVKYDALGDIFKIKVSQIKDLEGKEINCRNLGMLVKTNGFVGEVNDEISFLCHPRKVDKIYRNAAYINTLHHQGIIYSVQVNSDKLTKLGEVRNLSSKIKEFRDKLIILTENSSLKRETSNFLISVILGEKQLLDKETKSILNSAGMSHILAVSGLHVGIVFTLCLGILFPLALFRKYKLRWILALAMVWGYVCISGFAPSTFRAAVMITALVGGFLLERKNSALNALLLAALILLIINPYYLWDAGTLLSFVCVVAILLFVNKLNPIDHHKHPLTYKAVSAVFITIVTFFSTWILVAYYFKNIPLNFFLANILLLPLLPVFVGGGIFYLVFIFSGIDLTWLSNFLDKFLYYLINGVKILSFGQENVLNINVPVTSCLLWLAALLILAFYFNENRKKVKLIYLSVSTILSVSSVGLMITFNPTATANLIFKHNFTQIEARIVNDEESHTLIFPRNSISHLSMSKVHITAIDNYLKSESMKELTNLKNQKRNFLIIGPGADFNQISEIIKGSDFDKIILHSGIGKKKKEELLLLLDNDININKIHSLRDNGSWELEL